ncbi:MAG: HAMP domain-containing histidine kinase [Hahellaceae bacterium]|nr:HAMP domain-containing histidine kinase [Hahellaceae bacterium]MCP5169168.1 HAMP domain-containing histidine kinase [Hahellaceae bacterium]
MNILPRSLLQLVVLAFVLVLAPLGTLVFQASEALERVSEQGREATQDIVVLAKTSRSLPELIFDLERTARQYQVLGSPELISIYGATEARLLRDLDQLCLYENSLDSRGLCDEIRRALRGFSTRLYVVAYDSPEYADALTFFTILGQHAQSLVQYSERAITARSERLASDAELVKSRLLLQGASLVPLSIGLCILFIWLIIRPIARLEEIIQQLGSGQSRVQFQVGGPRELAKLGTKLAWLQERLKALEEQKLQFVRQMSHELKTPLASLREGTDLLEEGLLGELKPQQREIVTILQEKGRQLQCLIENLLDFNGLKYQRELLTTSFDFYSLVEEVLHEQRLTMHQLNIYYCLEGESLMVTADRAKLRTLLSNLLSNALFYSTSPGKVWLMWRAEQHRLIFDVANTGAAIPLAEQSRIFLPFEQGSRPRAGALKGSGIGLSVALECALLHGGTLTLESHAMAEVCFRLQMPLNPPKRKGSVPASEEDWSSQGEFPLVDKLSQHNTPKQTEWLYHGF